MNQEKKKTVFSISIVLLIIMVAIMCVACTPSTPSLDSLKKKFEKEGYMVQTESKGGKVFSADGHQGVIKILGAGKDGDTNERVVIYWFKDQKNTDKSYEAEKELLDVLKEESKKVG